MPKLPCIKDKCILLPLCKNKDDINCDKLLRMIYDHEYISEIDEMDIVILNLLHETFKPVFRVYGYLLNSNVKRIYHIYRSWMTTSRIYYGK